MSSTTITQNTDSTMRDYWLLLKPRVMTLVVFTAVAGMWVAPGSINPFMAVVAIVAIAINAGASGAINMWYDRDIDAVMNRTANRPIPAGRVNADDALAFGIFLSLGSLALMALATNWVAAAWLGIANLFYVFVYTIWLKRSTAQNIVIGGAAGAFPPIIGWAAVTGDVTIVPIALFLVIFLWTPPHFWALALYHEIEYGRAKIPMMPNVAGPESTRRQMMAYTLSLIPVVTVPFFFGAAGWIYLVGSLAVTLAFAFTNLRVLQRKDDASAKKMFGFSISYLFIVFGLLMFDRSSGVSFVF